MITNSSKRTQSVCKSPHDFDLEPQTLNPLKGQPFTLTLLEAFYDFMPIPNGN